MLTLAGPNATVYFANLSISSASALSDDLKAKYAAEASAAGPRANAVATHVGVKDLMAQHSVPLERVCLLDPKAEKELSPSDGDGKFEWFLFGVS